MNDHFQFKETCHQEVARQGADADLQQLSEDWVAKAADYNYPKHFEWLGRPIFQHPQDLVALQQLTWEVQPDLIIETGIARGGSLIFHASMLELLACCGGNPKAMALGIDMDIPEHLRAAILAHPMAKRIRMFQGSSTSATVADEVRAVASGVKRTLVCLRGKQTERHMLEELRLYAPLVSRGSYCVVFESMGNAVQEYLQSLSASATRGVEGEVLTYQVDQQCEDRLLITDARGGFLQRV